MLIAKGISNNLLGRNTPPLPEDRLLTRLRPSRARHQAREIESEVIAAQWTPHQQRIKIGTNRTCNALQVPRIRHAYPM